MTASNPGIGERLRDLHPTFTMSEAASRLGVSTSTVRRRVRSGRLRADRVLVGDGFEYRIYLDGAYGAEPSMNGSGNPSADASDFSSAKAVMEPSVERSAAMAAYNEALLRPLVETINSQQEIIRKQAEQVGRLSAELEQARGRIAVLEAPKGFTPLLEEEELEEPPRGWWGRVLARIYG